MDLKPELRLTEGGSLQEIITLATTAAYQSGLRKAEVDYIIKDLLIGDWNYFTDALNRHFDIIIVSEKQSTPQ